MTLQQLGEEYLAGEKRLRERIRLLRKRLPTLDSEEKKALEARLRGLYDMALSARRIGEYLKDYYKFGGRSEH